MLYGFGIVSAEVESRDGGAEVDESESDDEPDENDISIAGMPTKAIRIQYQYSKEHRFKRFIMF